MGKSSTKGRKPPPHKPVFAVSSTLLRKKDKEIQKRIKELKVNLKSVAGSIKTGNRPLTKRTKAIYAHLKRNLVNGPKYGFGLWKIRGESM
jgi:hypothetical protein